MPNMIKSISAFVANRKAAQQERRKRRKEPRGGQFISFEHQDVVGIKEFSWTKCEASFEELWHTCGEVHSTLPQMDMCGGKANTPDARSVTELTESTSPASSGILSLDSTPLDTPAPEGLAITRRPSVRNIRVSQDDYSGSMSLSGRQSAKISAWSRHAMVNKARGSLPPLTRCRELDDLARDQAKAMAGASRVFHSDPNELVLKLKSLPRRRLGENVFKAKTMAKLDTGLTEIATDYLNIIDKRYTKMGLATARDEKGTVYQCVLFSG